MRKLLLIAMLPLAGCAMNVTMMPRDSGKTYAGELLYKGGGSGTMAVSLDGDQCTGPAVRVASNESIGVINTFGRGGVGTGVVVSDAGNVGIKAMMTCQSGKGLRCDMTGRDGNGGGICTDDASRVFDVIIQRR